MFIYLFIHLFIFRCCCHLTFFNIYTGYVDMIGPELAFILFYFILFQTIIRVEREPNFFGGSATPCASPPPPRPSIFSNYSFGVHHLVNRDDRQLLAYAMASDFSVIWRFWFFVTDQTPRPYPTRSLPAQLNPTFIKGKFDSKS
jgi:hypothetical protein